MFEKFLQKYIPDTSVENGRVDPSALLNVQSAVDLVTKFGGASFNRGIYRLHSAAEIERWSEKAADVFPKHRNRIRCFGYDWLGRQFALDSQRSVDGDPAVLMLDPDTDSVFEVPASFEQFHEVELAEFANDTLAVEEFDSWLKHQKRPLGTDECVAFRVPLFLGGKDSMENRETMDISVHWELCAQLISQINKLPDGAAITQVKDGEL